MSRNTDALNAWEEKRAALVLARDALRLILADDESNRGSCPCGAKYVKVTRQRQAWEAVRAIDEVLV